MTVVGAECGIKPIQNDLLLAQKLGLGGTPSFIITSQNFSGPVKLTELEEILAGK